MLFHSWLKLRSVHLHHHLHHVTVSLMRRPKYDLGYIVRKLFKYEMFSGDIAIIYPKFPTFYEGGGFLGTHIPKPHTPPLLACYTTRVPLDHHAILHKPTKNSFHIKVSSISVNLELLMSSVRKILISMISWRLDPFQIFRMCNVIYPHPKVRSNRNRKVQFTWLVGLGDCVKKKNLKPVLDDFFSFITPFINVN